MIVMLLLSLVGLVLRDACVSSAADLRAALGGYIRVEYATTEKQQNPINETLVSQVLQMDGVAEANGISHYFLYAEDLILTPGSHAGTPVGQIPRMIGNDNSALNENFLYNSFEVVQGRHIAPGDQGCAVISDVLAQNNGLALGDTFTVYVNEYTDTRMGEQSIPFSFEVVGIFTIREAWDTSSLMAERDLPQNFIYTDMASAHAAGAAADADYVPYYRNGVLFTLDDPALLPEISQNMQKLPGIDWSKYTVSINDKAYSDSAASLSYLERMCVFLVIITLGMCTALLVLTLSLWVRERRHEIGALLSFGLTKASIWKQLLIETVLLACAALLVAFILANPIVHLISGTAFDAAATHVARSQEEQIDPVQELTFTVNPVADAPAQTPDADAVYLKAGTGVTLIVCTIAIVVVAVTWSAVPVFRYKPREILSSAE